MSRYIAIDLGGGSGRVICGEVIGESINLEEIYRFPNNQITRNGHLCWNHESILKNILIGLGKAASKYDDIISIGIDSWGVDFALVDKNGNIIGDTVCYRDNRTEGMMENVFSIISPSEHYSKTGIQQMSINTLFQLYSLKKNVNKESGIDIFKDARLLFTPDYYAYKLCGVMANEYTIASTSELLDANTRNWDFELIDKLGLPKNILGDIIQPGTKLGNITKDIALQTGLKENVKVIATCGHDTACAVASLGEIPLNSAYLSSGTWSLLGIKINTPILSEQARLAGFTNEGGDKGCIRFLQNITGLWTLQCLMRQWKREDYPTLLEEARKSNFNIFIDIDDDSLVNPKNMEKAIYNLINKTKKIDLQEIVLTHGDYIKIILLSLANRYKKGLSDLEKISGKKISTLYIMGGGSKNTYLNELTQKATGIKVIPSNSEATALGNILIQNIGK